MNKFEQGEQQEGKAEGLSDKVLMGLEIVADEVENVVRSSTDPSAIIKLPFIIKEIDRVVGGDRGDIKQQDFFVQTLQGLVEIVEERLGSAKASPVFTGFKSDVQNAINRY